jgi:hypothetical protein
MPPKREPEGETELQVLMGILREAQARAEAAEVRAEQRGVAREGAAHARLEALVYGLQARRTKKYDECYNCHRKGHYSKDCLAERVPRSTERRDEKKGANKGVRHEEKRPRKTSFISQSGDNMNKMSTRKSKEKANESPGRNSVNVNALRSSGVLRLGATSSRAAPVFEIVAIISDRKVRMGVDTRASVSCVSRSDLTKEELEKAKPTLERLHHAGGEALPSKVEVSLEVEMGGGKCMVTFNVIETGRCKLGFFLGMDVLDKHNFLLDTSTRTANYCGKPMPKEELEELRTSREQKFLAAGIEPVVYDLSREEQVSDEEQGREQPQEVPVRNVGVQCNFEDELENERRRENGKNVNVDEYRTLNQCCGAECDVKEVEGEVVMSSMNYQCSPVDSPEKRSEEEEEEKKHDGVGVEKHRGRARGGGRVRELLRGPRELRLGQLESARRKVQG